MTMMERMRQAVGWHISSILWYYLTLALLSYRISKMQWSLLADGMEESCYMETASSTSPMPDETPWKLEDFCRTKQPSLGKRVPRKSQRKRDSGNRVQSAFLIYAVRPSLLVSLEHSLCNHLDVSCILFCFFGFPFPVPPSLSTCIRLRFFCSPFLLCSFSASSATASSISGETPSGSCCADLINSYQR